MKNLTKQELIIPLERVEQMLSTAVQDANTAAKNYSKDAQSSLAFEVGFLGSTVTSTHQFVSWVKEGKKQSLNEFIKKSK